MSLLFYETNRLLLNVGLCMFSGLGAYRGWNIAMKVQKKDLEDLNKKPLYTINLYAAGTMAGIYGIFPVAGLVGESVHLEYKLRNN